MSTSGLDAYAVVTAQPPEPPPEPDPAAIARAKQQYLFGEEHAGAAWTAPLSPVRGSRQRTPAPPEGRDAPDDAHGTERSAMCILDSHGTHVSPGLHCPHNLPAAGDPDEVVATVRF